MMLPLIACDALGHVVHWLAHMLSVTDHIALHKMLVCQIAHTVVYLLQRRELLQTLSLKMPRHVKTCMT